MVFKNLTAYRGVNIQMNHLADCIEAEAKQNNFSGVVRVQQPDKKSSAVVTVMPISRISAKTIFILGSALLPGVKYLPRSLSASWLIRD